MDRKALELFGINALNSIKNTKCIIGRSTSGVYEDVATGKLRAVKIGGATRITGTSIVDYIERAPSAVITTGLVARGDDLTSEQRENLAKTTRHGSAMRKKRRGRPIGSRNRPRVHQDSKIRPTA